MNLKKSKAGVEMCFWLMFVMILKSLVSPTCCMTWRRVKEENSRGGLLNLHQTTRPNFEEYPYVPGRRTQRPQLLQGHLGRMDTRGSGDLAQLGGCLDSSDASTPGPSTPGIMYRHHWASWMWKGEQRKVWGVHLALARGCASAPTSSVSCRH